MAPLKVFFDGETTTATLQVRNSGNEKTAIQAKVLRWTVTEDGRDAFEDTQDFVLFPRIFEIASGEEGVVRLAYRGETGLQTERAYRIFLRELPTLETQTEGVGFLIELSVPIFVRSKQPRTEGSITQAALEEGRAQLRIENRGSEFFLVDGITATGQGENGEETFRSHVGGWYVLAGTTRLFSVEINPEDCRRSRRVTVEAAWNGATHSIGFGVDPELCPAQPPPTRPGFPTGQ